MTREEHLADTSVLKALDDVRITITHAPGRSNGLGLTGISFGLLYKGALVVEPYEDGETPQPYVWGTFLVSNN